MNKTHPASLMAEGIAALNNKRAANNEDATKRLEQINLAEVIELYGNDLDQMVKEGSLVEAIGILHRIDRATVSLRIAINSQLDRLARI